MRRRFAIRIPRVDGWARQAVMLLVVPLVSCAGKAADFGTLPQVSVPIEKKPEQDPTLFREDQPQSLPPTTTDPPDPRPLRARDHFDFLIEFNKGAVDIVSVRSVRTHQPQSSERRLGRFALELWSGSELVERVRFDFPLLAASDAHGEDPLGAGLSSRTKVRVPASSRASRARILDRKTRRELEVAWPPTADKSPADTQKDGGEAEEDEPEEDPSNEDRTREDVLEGDRTQEDETGEETNGS